MDIYIQAAKWIPMRVNATLCTHVIIKLSKITEKNNPESSKRKGTHHVKRNIYWLKADVSVETLQVRRQWYGIFNMLERKELPTKNTVSVKLPFKDEGETKTFPAR